MNAQPRTIEHGMGDFNPPDDSRREAAIEARTEQLIAEMWQDNEHLSDAVSDASITIGLYHKDGTTPQSALDFLKLCSEKTDHCEIGRRLIASMEDYISDTASDRAKEEFDGEVEL
jgi:hypothetical protein